MQKVSFSHLRPLMGWGLVLLVFASVGVAQALALRYPLVEVGIFHQILWSLSHGEGFWSSIRAGTGNALLDEFAPSLVLFVPAFSLLGASPVALPILHAGLLTGILAACARIIPKRAPLVILGLVFVLDLARGFHLSALAACAFSWAFVVWKGNGSESVRRFGALALLLIGAFSGLVGLVLALMVLAWAAYRDLREGQALRAVGTLGWLGILAGAFVFVGGFEKLGASPLPRAVSDRDGSTLMQDARDLAPVRAAMLAIPPEARVMGEDWAGPWIAGRKHVARFPETKLLLQGCPDYVVFREQTWNTIRGSDEMRALVSRCLERPLEDPPRVESPAGAWRIGAFRGR